jgi:hypothetical protein
MDVFMYINEVISYTIKNKPVNDLCCAAGVWLPDLTTLFPWNCFHVYSSCSV